MKYNEIEQFIGKLSIGFILCIICMILYDIINKYYTIKIKINSRKYWTTYILSKDKKFINLTDDKLTCIINVTKNDDKNTKKYIIKKNNFDHKNIFDNLQKYFVQNIYFVITEKQYNDFIIPKIQSGEIERYLMNEYIYIAKKYKPTFYALCQKTYSSYYYLKYSYKYNKKTKNNNPYNEIKKLNN